MATLEYSGAEVLRRHHGELMDILNALSDPVSIAENLFAKQIITEKTLQKITSHPVHERNQIILEAVHHTIKAKQGRLLEFVDVLTALDRLSLSDGVVAKIRCELSKFLETGVCAFKGRAVIIS